jgi:hypothetical protein
MMLLVPALLGACASPVGTWTVIALDVNGTPQELVETQSGASIETTITLDVTDDLAAELHIILSGGATLDEAWLGQGEQVERGSWAFQLSGPGPVFPVSCAPEGDALICDGLYDDTDDWHMTFTPTDG